MTQLLRCDNDVERFKREMERGKKSEDFFTSGFSLIVACSFCDGCKFHLGKIWMKR